MNRHPLAIALLFGLSGFAGLVYEVLWLKELGLLFGNTAQAATTTLAAFFLGLAAGGWYWGRRSPGWARPLRAYAWLEFAVAAAAIPYFGLLPAFRALYEPLNAVAGEAPAAMTAAKFLLASAILFPPAFFMGGTLPAMGQHLIRRQDQLGRTGPWLYGVNTVGAAAGAFCAGFYLPRVFGFVGGYFVAIAANVAVGAVAWALDAAARQAPEPPARPPKKQPATRPRPAEAAPAPWGLAFLSGFLTLGLEVLWTRMFSQVLQNSVYTFSAILVVFLVVLAAGGFVAGWLARLRLRPEAVLAVLLAVAGFGAAASPFWFMDVTNGMRYVGSGLSWNEFVPAVFSRVFLVLAGPGLAIGVVFPYLLRAAEGAGAPGTLLGRLAAWNTLGAVAGSVAAGFLILPSVGMWGGVRLMSLAYFLLALSMAKASGVSSRALAALPALGAILLLGPLDPTRLPLLRFDERHERVLDIWQGGHGIVAVVERSSGLRIKVNNFYRLGGSASLEHEQNQTLIPLMSHPAPDEVFFLGLGTGITAGAALSQPVRRVVVCELTPEVILAAAKHFNGFANGLFDDPRVRVLATDGRNRLAGSRERYDAILADLFIPWKQGAGSLYSLEHFRTVSRRLKPNGIFMQWLPLYQVSEDEFAIIARTMLEVFPEVVVWRGDFYPDRPILGLLAANEPLALDPEALVERGRSMSGRADLPPEAVYAVTLPFYGGNLARARALLGDGPINTDARPVIEYGSPLTHRAAGGRGSDWFTGSRLAAFFERLRQAAPPEKDPYLARLTAEQRNFVRAGWVYYEGAVAERAGDKELADRRLAEFDRLIPRASRPSTEDADSGLTEEP